MAAVFTLMITTPEMNGGNSLGLPPVALYLLGLVGAVGIAIAFIEFRKARKTGVI